MSRQELLHLLLANGIAWFENNFSEEALFSATRKFLHFCGSYSLEIYLMHSLLFAEPSLLLNNLFDSSDLLMLINKGRILSYTLLAAVSIATAYLLTQIVRYSGYLVKKSLFAT